VTTRQLFPPLLGRYLCRQVLGAFGLTLSAFVAISLIAEFFDRFDTFLQHDASVWAMARTFALQIPMVITQVTPLAVLAAALVYTATVRRRVALADEGHLPSWAPRVVGAVSLALWTCVVIGGRLIAFS